MTTIRDVAKMAKVSVATVSRTLSQPDKVNEIMRKRVQAAVAKLGYEPNRAARSLRTLKSSKILVTVPDISNPFFSDVIRGAEEAAREADYSVVLGDTRSDPVIENSYATMFKRREVDGFIFLGHRLPEILATSVAASEVPMPIVHGCEYSPGLQVSSVHIDNVAAGADALRHLVDLGHRNIGVITGPLDSPLSRDRLEGARRIAQNAGLADILVRSGDFSVESGFAEASQLLCENDVSAIFCFSDELAIGALRAVRHLGLTCPDDVSLVGCDDIRFARFLNPPLTTIAQPSAQIGRRAVRMLLEILDGHQDGLESVTLSHRLIVRQSSAAPSLGRLDSPRATTAPA
ncbi:LacI family transcriptional regulator [Sphingobium cupriresistens LL01]|uniref:LacI family transcriptional regulator n=2 Tax=Sphingomonadaceae TaxID=41297 RepID=A0A0J7XK92_9SPHN|nr:LacI family transcriptional regulator [Sphingobium cupriresistens LL01]MBJ7376652.1 LacI family DNA-binding transcriptional regulator [Sphingobium sp.]